MSYYQLTSTDKQSIGFARFVRLTVGYFRERHARFGLFGRRQSPVRCTLQRELYRSLLYVGQATACTL
jgi:hypothetical protein